ncbi:FAD-dependent monooxygenase [Streptomyces sp. NRRL S-87]|uniref:FAD-dependent monooxygenase n=1 Tax=Streptomyces sp. NRRL S-87 TaxID=1463920 RepID=UPI000AC92B78|nr:FAD-dependent monooxygenase [Streptomyces sp. NRRL S-87]
MSEMTTQDVTGATGGSGSAGSGGTTGGAEVLVVGAGPTGLTLACDLSRRGVAVRVLERAARPHRESRGKTLHPRSLDVLTDLGAGEGIAATGTAHQVFRKYFDGEHVSDTDPFAPAEAGASAARFDSAVFLAQWQTEGFLRERLEELGGRVEFGAEVTALSQDAEGVRATLADGSVVTAAYAVGCDGGRSTVRRLLGVAFEGHGGGGAEESMVVGDVEAPGLSRDVWHQWFTDGGAVLMWPVPGTETFQFQAGIERDAEGAAVPPSLEGFQRAFDRHAKVPGIRLGEATWLSTWRVNVRMARSYRRGRVFLAGDAAHVHPIAGGLGMNTGIQDAFNLGWKLAETLAGRGGPELLDTYEEERLPIAAWTLKITDDRMRHVVSAVRTPGTGIEEALTDEVPTGYRWSSLAGAQGTAALAPGDVAPDVRLAGGGRLYDVLAGPEFTLLGIGAGAGTALREVADGWSGPLRTHRVAPADEAAVRGAFGVPGEALVLIRPDHHLALLVPGADPEPVAAWLRGRAR